MKGIPKENLVGESRCNGEIESAVKDVKGLMRRNYMEHGLGTRVEWSHPFLTWLADVADVLSRRSTEKMRTCKKGGDQRSSLAR